MNKPLTVLVCTHNRADLLRGALESLEPTRFEVLVVDNASTDATPAVVAECAARAKIEIRCARETELGLDAARNRGLREAAGEFVAFLDDDARARHDWAAEIL